MEAFSFNKIYVIESLKVDDNLTGKELYDDLLKWQEVKTKGKITAEYCQIRNIYEWDSNISKIINECKEKGIRPIIHIEMHGIEKEDDKDWQGFRLSSGEDLTYQDFGDSMRKINKECGCNLFITLAVCYGLYSIFSLKENIKQVMPFCAALGSFEDLKEGDLTIRYNEFYDELLTSFDLSKAFLRLQNSNPDIPSQYHIIYIDDIFYHAYYEYLTKLCTRESIRERAMSEANRNGIKFINRQERRAYIRSFEKIEKATRQKEYDRFKNDFFMLDQFPQNIKRFNIPKTWQELKLKFTLR